jgi:hypothetical protein
MHLAPIDYLLWFIVPLVQLGVLVALFRRGFGRDYPFFFAYTLFDVASVVILAALSRMSYTLYYYGYYVNLVLCDMISFAVVWEILKAAFQRHKRPWLPGSILLLFRLSFLLWGLERFWRRKPLPATSRMVWHFLTERCDSCKSRYLPASFFWAGVLEFHGAVLSMERDLASECSR